MSNKVISPGTQRMLDGKSAPLEIQIAFNILAILLGAQLYETFLKDTIGNGKTLDEIVGLK
jgi:hypothetical protein